ncbi:hypothetical protein HPB47_002452, partial [Ixodes persulcatus]
MLQIMQFHLYLASKSRHRLPPPLPIAQPAPLPKPISLPLTAPTARQPQGACESEESSYPDMDTLASCTDLSELALCTCSLAAERRGRRRKLSIEDQHFLVLVKLRVGLFHKHLGHLMDVSEATALIKSGLLERPFEARDSVMADKGSKIQDLLEKKGVSLNIPPFLTKEQFLAGEVQETQDIAALRIH